MNTSSPWRAVTLTCPHCGAKQSVDVVALTGYCRASMQIVNCASCLERFEAELSSRMVRGPLLVRVSSVSASR
jgi:transcription elongation factor Elf1